MFVIALAAGAMPNAQSTFMSAPLAGTLSRLFENTGTYAFAAPDPEDAGRFVAVMYIPGGKLFVVSAESDMPYAISRSIADHAYRDVYLALLAESTGKFYVEDARANGLLHALAGSDAVDFVYDGRRTTRFNSDPQSQHLSGTEYDTRFAEADQRYAHMLHVLIDAARAHARVVLGHRRAHLPQCNSPDDAAEQPRKGIDAMSIPRHTERVETLGQSFIR